jgi:hypothetical protein
MAVSKLGGFTIKVQKPRKRGYTARLVIETRYGAQGGSERWGRDMTRDGTIKLAIQLLRKCL